MAFLLNTFSYSYCSDFSHGYSLLLLEQKYVEVVLLFGFTTQTFFGFTTQTSFLCLSLMHALWRARAPGARPVRGGAAQSHRSQGCETCPGYLPNSTWPFRRAPSRAPRSGQSEGYNLGLWRDTTEVSSFDSVFFLIFYRFYFLFPEEERWTWSELP